MGHKILIFFIGAFTLLFAQSRYPEIDSLIEKVKTKRVGLDKETIVKLKNPFVSEKKLSKIEHKKLAKRSPYRKRWFFKLSSIFDKRARINGRWYKIGSKIGTYRLVHIGDNYVVLATRKKELRLYLNKKKRKIIKTWSR